MQTYVSLWVKTFGGSVALELQKIFQNYKQELVVPVSWISQVLSRPIWDGNPTVPRYRNVGDPIAMLDSKAHSTVYGEFYDKKNIDASVR